MQFSAYSLATEQTMGVSLADNVLSVASEAVTDLTGTKSSYLQSGPTSVIFAFKQCFHSMTPNLPRQCKTQYGSVTSVNPNHPFHKYQLCCFLTKLIAVYISHQG